MTNPFYSTPFWIDLKRQALRRDGYRCTVEGCPSTSHLVVDHVLTRPPVPYRTALDRLDNLRTLCRQHDNSVKETAGGGRRQDGRLYVKGCDAAGNPLDPKHHWNSR